MFGKRRRLRKRMQDLEKRYNQNWDELYTECSTELHNKILKLKRQQIRHRMEIVQRQLDALKGKKADVKASA